MSFYDAFKDAINLAQKADNIALYRQLLDLSAQALDLQAENTQLKEENAKLKKDKINEERITRHQETYITLLDDPHKLKYCSVCWDRDHKLIQMVEIFDDYKGESTLFCHNCNHNCFIDNCST